MKFWTLIRRAAEPRGWLRVGITKLAVGITLVLGLAANHSSWAQQCQRGLYLSQDKRFPSDAENYPIKLNDVTLGNQITWAAQAFVAPERLEGLVPLYVYETDMNNAGSLLKAFRDAQKNENLHLGLAIYMKDGQGDKQEVWRARPYPPNEDLDTDLSKRESGAGGGIETGSGDFDSLCIVSNRRLGDVPAVEKLWIPEVEWQDGLAQVQ